MSKPQYTLEFHIRRLALNMAGLTPDKIEIFRYPVSVVHSGSPQNGHDDETLMPPHKGVNQIYETTSIRHPPRSEGHGSLLRSGCCLNHLPAAHR